MDIETKWLRDFLVLTQCKNFSQAAQLRYLTQPAFSRRIQALEKSVGYTLINRTKQPIELTRHGEEFQNIAIDIIKQFDSGLDKLSQLQNDKLTIDFAATHTLSLGLYPLLLDKLAQHLPEHRTRLKVADADDCIRLLKSNNCDVLLAFHDSDLMFTQFNSFVVTEVQFVPVCLTRQKSRFSSFEMPIPFLAYQPHIFLGRIVNKLLAMHPYINLQTVAEAPMADSLKMLMLQGLGIAWLPKFTIQKELDSGEVCIIGDTQLQTRLEVRLYQQKNNSEQQKLLWHELKNKLEHCF